MFRGDDFVCGVMWGWTVWWLLWPAVLGELTTVLRVYLSLLWCFWVLSRNLLVLGVGPL